MHPRWFAVLGFMGLCTSFACFPPMGVVPVSETWTSTGATPRPSGWTPTPYQDAFASPSAGPAASPTGSAAAPNAAPPAAYFPARAGTWRYRVITSAAGAPAATGERVFTVSEVSTTGATTTAVGTTTVKLNLPGFTALDQAEARSSLSLAPTGFAQTEAARTTSIPVPLAAGQTWTENGLTVRAASITEAVTLATLEGRTFSDVWRLEYAVPAAPGAPIATVWLAPGAGPIRRQDVFQHDGKTWTADASLVDYPGK